MTTSPIENPAALLDVPGRDGLFFHFGLFAGMRQAEICSLKWGDVVGRGKVRVKVKGGKWRTFPLNFNLQEKIKEVYKDQPLDNYIFTSVKGPNKPLTRKAVGDIVRRWFEEKEIVTDYPASHALRKTFGRTVYENYDEVAAMTALGHSNLEVTMRYIGVTKEKEEEVFEKISYTEDPFSAVPGLAQFWGSIKREPNARITIEQFIRSFLDDESQVRSVLNRL